MFDYSNLRKVLLPAGIATDEGVPPEWQGPEPFYLLDLSRWGVTSFAFWPLVKDPSIPDLLEYQRWIDPMTVTSVDMVNMCIYWTRPTENWTLEEIAADLAPKRKQAIYDITRDAEAFYSTVASRRALEQPIALDAALAFRAAEYIGTPPPAVSGAAAANDQTAEEAADGIIAAFDQVDEALGKLFAQRVACQEAVLASTVNGELNAAKADWTAAYAAACAAAMIVPRYSY